MGKADGSRAQRHRLVSARQTRRPTREASGTAQPRGSDCCSGTGAGQHLWWAPTDTRGERVPCVSSCSSRLSSSANSRGSYLMSCTLESRISISSFKSCTVAGKKTNKNKTFTEHLLSSWCHEDGNSQLLRAL